MATCDETTARSINLTVLRGVVRGEPSLRILPSGSEILQFDVATVLEERQASAPVVLADPTDADLRVIRAESAVVVLGSVRRRFFRSGGATQSRTEVVAARVVGQRRSKSVDRLLAEATAALGPA